MVLSGFSPSRSSPASGLRIFGCVPTCMNEPDLGSAISQLADPLPRLSLAAPKPRWSQGSVRLQGPTLLCISLGSLQPSSLVGTTSLKLLLLLCLSIASRACRPLVGSGATPEQRASIAWVAGLWAKQLVLSDCVPAPRPSARLPSSLRPRFYIVFAARDLRAHGSFLPDRPSRRRWVPDLASFGVLGDGHLKFFGFSWPDAEERAAPVTDALGILVRGRRHTFLCIQCGCYTHRCRDPSPVGGLQGRNPGLLAGAWGGLVSGSIFPFSLHQPEPTPLSDELLTAARSWLSESPLGRAVYYSAQEEAAQVPLPVQDLLLKGRKANPKKRVTTADLAAQLAHILPMLPALTEQLTSVKDRQEAL